jgi:hypothetical protein
MYINTMVVTGKKKSILLIKFAGGLLTPSFYLPVFTENTPGLKLATCRDICQRFAPSV